MECNWQRETAKKRRAEHARLVSCRLRCVLGRAGPPSFLLQVVEPYLTHAFLTAAAPLGREIRQGFDLMDHCDTTPLAIAVAGTAAASILLFVIPALTYAYLKHRRRHLLHERILNEQLRTSIGTTHKLDCPAAYIRGDLFCSLGRLRSPKPTEY